MGWRDWFGKKNTLQLRPVRGLSVHDDKDAAVLAQLTKVGADLSKPREVNVYCYAPDEDSAGLMWGVLTRLEFEATMGLTEGSSSASRPYGVYGTKVMITSLESMSRLRKLLEELANEVQGEYDGWEAAVEPRLE